MRKILALAALLSYPASGFALTLQEALTHAYNHHDDLKIIRNDFLNEIEHFPAALSEFMPRLNAHFDSTDSRVSRIPSVNSLTRENHSFNRTLRLEQPLFNGGSSVARLKSAQAGFKAARSGFYAKEQEIIMEEITAYLDCAEAKEKYEISKISVKSNKTQLEAMKEKFKLGESTETEVASAEAGLASAEANEAVAYANYEAAKANFYKVFGVEPVAIAMPDTPTQLPDSLEVLIEKALALNPDMHKVKNSAEASKATEMAAKGALLPRVTFRVEEGRNLYNPQDNDNILRTGGANNNTKTVTSTLSVDVPILGSGGAEYSEIRKAKYQTRRVAVQLDSQIKQVKASCKASWEGYNASMHRISATNQAVRAAEVAYEGMVQEEMLGSKTIVDVLNIEERLNAQRQARVEARKQSLLAAFRIKSLTGDLTAKSMGLPVDYFNPEQEFKRVKLKIIGF